MILVNGVSGFNVPERNTGMDELFFKKVCYSVVLYLDGNILAFNESGVSLNYYGAKINIFNEELFILLNHVYRFIAFASIIEHGNIEFIDHEKLKNEFSQYYRVLTLNELSQPLIMNQIKGRLEIKNENDLNEAELKNIKYWEASTVGDVVFNNWD